MKPRRSCLIALFATIAFAQPGRAQVESGPVPGAKVAALKVNAATGEFADNEVDYAEKRKGKPTIYVFVQSPRWDRPMARYLKTLDAGVKKAGSDAQVVAVWLTADPKISLEYLPKAQMSLNMETTALAVYAGATTGPDNWGINDRASLTAVVTDGETCTARFAYVSLNDTDVPAVEKALKEVLDKKAAAEKK
jgi:hypothetical protein